MYLGDCFPPICPLGRGAQILEVGASFFLKGSTLHWGERLSYTRRETVGPQWTWVTVKWIIVSWPVNRSILFKNHQANSWVLTDICPLVLPPCSITVQDAVMSNAAVPLTLHFFFLVVVSLQACETEVLPGETRAAAHLNESHRWPGSAVQTDVGEAVGTNCDDDWPLLFPGLFTHSV